jgi:hypothetical protein
MARRALGSGGLGRASGIHLVGVVIVFIIAASAKTLAAVEKQLC